MTRYARKGAGNPKVPLEGSSWKEMHKEKRQSLGSENSRQNIKHKHKDKRKKFIKNKQKDKANHLLSEMGKIDFQSEEEKREFKTFIKKEKRSEARRVKRIDQRADDKVCFNCRKHGHQISDCPKAKHDVDQGTGICFKCGSTEHASSKCRVKLPPGEFPFAKCFICGEMGHLSSSCQDNPRGLYPNGGCCNTCGSVEHYKRDCPEHLAKQGISSTTLATLNNSHSADDEPSLQQQKSAVKKKTGPKVVKF